MSITETLNSALSGLHASQAGLKAVSNNISNVNTPGYARQKSTFTPMVLGGRTSGVRVGNVERIANKFLETASFSAAGDVGRYGAVSTYAERMQTMLGQPGEPTSLSSKLELITSSAVEMTNPGISSIAQQAFVDAVDAGLMEMKTLGEDIEQLKQDADSEIQYSISRINTLLQRIEDLNNSISVGVVTGRAPEAYIDQRVAALDELGELVKINTREQPDGRVYVELPNGIALVDKSARALTYNSADSSIDQTVYQPITVSFVDSSTGALKPTGEKIEVGSTGGKLGGLLDVRDRVLNAAQADLGKIYSDLSMALNSVSNSGTSVPAQRTLEGRSTGLLGTDALNFTGSTSFATVDGSGRVIAKVDVDFGALGPGATIDDAINAINAGLGGSATASFVDGRLTLQAANTSHGVAIAGSETDPGSRGGFGFSQFFGMNDVIKSEGAGSLPAGLTYGDNHGFPAGQVSEFVLRDASGKIVARHSLSTGVGPTVGDLVTDMNSSPLSSYGVFSLNEHGGMEFASSGGNYTLVVASDGTSRTGTQARLTDMLAAGDAWGFNQLDASDVSKELSADGSRLPMSQLNPNAAVGDVGVLSGDSRLANSMVDVLTGLKNSPGVGMLSLDKSVTNYIGRLSLEAASFQENSIDASARLDDILLRREAVSGVNIDEELAQMIVYQNSYGASARMITAAQEMFDMLIGIAR